MNRFWLTSLLVSGWVYLAVGQSAPNPFELLHRLPKVAAAAGSASADRPVLPVNPFDMAPHRAPAASLGMAANTTEAFNPFAVLPRGGGLSPWVMAFLLLTAFGFLTFSVATNRGAVAKAWAGFVSDNGFAVAQREASGFVGSTPYYLLYINFLFNAGIFMFLVTRVFMRDTYNNPRFLLLCLAGATVLFLSKHLMISLSRWLFPVENEVKKYNFLIIIFNCVLGLFLVPFNLLISFSTTKPTEQLPLVAWMLGLVAIFYLYRSLRASPIGIKILTQSPFHFLLYLCTVEIAPLLVLVKFALMQAG